MPHRDTARLLVVVSARVVRSSALWPASVIAALLAFLPGCGPSNVEACTAYVEKVNAEYTTCGAPNRIDATNTCPAYLDRGGADCSEYYACLAEEIECRDGTIVHRGEIADGGPDDRRCSGCL